MCISVQMYSKLYGNSNTHRAYTLHILSTIYDTFFFLIHFDVLLMVNLCDCAVGWSVSAVILFVFFFSRSLPISINLSTFKKFNVHSNRKNSKNNKKTTTINKVKRTVDFFSSAQILFCSNLLPLK